MERYGLYDVESGCRLRDATADEYRQYKQATGGYYTMKYGLCDVRREVVPPPIPDPSDAIPRFVWFDSIPPPGKKP